MLRMGDFTKMAYHNPNMDKELERLMSKKRELLNLVCFELAKIKKKMDSGDLLNEKKHRAN